MRGTDRATWIRTVTTIPPGRRLRGCTEVHAIRRPGNTGSRAFRRGGLRVSAATRSSTEFPPYLDYDGPGEPRVTFRRLL